MNTPKSIFKERQQPNKKGGKKPEQITHKRGNQNNQSYMVTEDLTLGGRYTKQYTEHRS